jgi:hypothetical protein
MFSARGDQESRVDRNGCWHQVVSPYLYSASFTWRQKQTHLWKRCVLIGISDDGQVQKPSNTHNDACPLTDYLSAVLYFFVYDLFSDHDLDRCATVLTAERGTAFVASSTLALKATGLLQLN